MSAYASGPDHRHCRGLRQLETSQPMPLSDVAWSERTEDSTVAKLDQSDRDHLSSRQYAFPKQRKEPLEDASHVRNAVARFDQVKDVTDAERDEAWKRIKAAAERFDVKLEERSWRELGKPKT
jgi:hypothetical protein